MHCEMIDTMKLLNVSIISQLQFFLCGKNFKINTLNTFHIYHQVLYPVLLTTVTQIYTLDLQN